MKKLTKTVSVLIATASLLLINLTARRQPPVEQIPEDKHKLNMEQIRRTEAPLKGQPDAYASLYKNPSVGQLKGLFRDRSITTLQDYSYILMPRFSKETIESLEQKTKQTINADWLRILNEGQKGKAQQILTPKILEQLGATPTKKTLHELLTKGQITQEEYNSIWNYDGSYTGFTIAQIIPKNDLDGFSPKGAMFETRRPLPPTSTVFIGPFFVPFEKDKVDVVLAMRQPIKQPRFLLFTSFGQFKQNDFETPLDINNSIIKWSQINRNLIYGDIDSGIAQCNITNNDPTDAFYTIPLNPQLPPKPQGENPPPAPGPSEPFKFLVYGDTREEKKLTSNPMPGKQYLQQGSVFVETVEFIKNHLISQQPKPILHLHTGDFVYTGRFAQQWVEVLEELNKITKNTYFAAAIGNHEIYSSDTLRNDPTIPHFGNIFNFPRPIENPIEYFEQVKETQRWFDIGCVRFIHLPLIHEKVNTREPKVVAVLKSTFDSKDTFAPEIISKFIKNLKEASQERGKNREIKFIIVYGHIPLVTSPEYEVPHKGLFEIPVIKPNIRDHLASAAANIEYAFKQYKPDAYFCGHNHLYDRVTWNGIPMITMGIGTHLKSCHERTSPRPIASQIGKFITTETNGGKIIGALECMVKPEENKIECKLALKTTDLPRKLTISPVGRMTGEEVLAPQSRNPNIEYLDYFEIETKEARARKETTRDPEAPIARPLEGPLTVIE